MNSQNLFQKALTGLLVSILVFGSYSCKKDSDNNNPMNTNPELPTVRVDSVGSISLTSAKVYGAILAEGKSAVLAVGIAWGLNPEPTVFDNNIPSSGFGVGRFNKDLTGLAPGITYYVRVYATNAVGTAYSPQKSFITSPPTLPVLTTNAVSDVSESTASSGGSITFQGSSDVTERGLCWSTSPNPTITGGGKVVAGNGTGVFSAPIAGLNLATKYYIRAYATNSEGTGYGNELNFTTLNILLTDIDGNAYNPVIIGTQIWMKTNLKTTRYRDGSTIPTGLDEFAWEATTSGATAIYDNNATNNATYGKLYNFYAVADPRGLCPTGWHVPSDAEWTTLENFLGGASIAGGKLKAVSSLWTSPNTGPTDESGFSALPGGFRNSLGSNVAIGDVGGWWSSTEFSAGDAWARGLNYLYGGSLRESGNKQNGFSVRCLRD